MACASEECACAVVRQRLVEANHHARECNAPDQSMSDGREPSRLLKSNANRNERSRSEARGRGSRMHAGRVREDAGSAGDEAAAGAAGSRRFP
jgi:hypothetical protein